MLIKIEKLIFALLAIVSLYGYGIPFARAGIILQAPKYIGLNNGLVGYWTFDGKDMAGSRAYDASGQGNTGTLTNGPVRTAGKLGQALSFDGVNDYVETTSSSVLDVILTNKYTWSAWIRPDDLHEYNLAWSPNHAGSSAGINIFALTTTVASIGTVTAGISVQMICNNEFGLHSTDNVITQGSWAHVLVTYDGSLSVTNRVTIYVNGADVTDRTDVFNDGALCNLTDNVLLVGSNAFGGADLFHGAVDEVRSYNRLLSPAEIKRLYNIGGTLHVNTSNLGKNGTLTQGLVGYWSFDGKDMAGNYAMDASGNGNRGTLTNGPIRTAGKIGQALKFDGGTTFVDLGDPATLSNIPVRTISAWIYPRTLGGSNFGSIIGTNDRNVIAAYLSLCSSDSSECPSTANTFVYNQHFTGGGLGAEWYAPANTIKLNQWQHIAVAYDRTSTANVPTFYYNGVNITATRSGTPTGSASDDSAVPKAIGSDMGTDGSSPSGTFNGLIDEVRIYNRALSPAEVKRLYNIGR